jgi:hypothetical protein
LTAIGHVATEAVPPPSASTLRAISSSPPARRRTVWPRTGSIGRRVRSRPWRHMPWARGPCGC